MRKVLIATIVAMVLFAVGAFAASFTLTAEDIASGADGVDTCASAVEVKFDTKISATAPYVHQIDKIHLDVTAAAAPAPSCVGKPLEVRLLKADGTDAVAAIRQPSLAYTNGNRVTITGLSIPISDVTRTAVLIGDVVVS